MKPLTKGYTTTKEKDLILYNIVTVCPYCHKKTIVYLTEQQVKKLIEYRTSKKQCIQNVFPELNASTREMLKTGICDNCWELITKE